ncbi:MAG: hypothetical protein RMK18_08960 [Armatimonadota bacterium]|nr:hypothetical protein [Armatimonadota bacterium]MCX7777495.1 hypothetical protein [Armatimonadota bacterium]MDW8025971.1 hypothetical protein [Armatimonadota bacterium]
MDVKDEVKELVACFSTNGNVVFRAASSDVGTFALVASARASGGREFANIMARMFTIFGFNFQTPTYVPEGVELPSSIGFVSFVDELRSSVLLNGWACTDGQLPQMRSKLMLKRLSFLKRL